MAVNPADVRVGRCFITTGGQVRQVTEITADGKVRYLARGGKWKGTWGTDSPLSNPPTLAKFAADVDRRVRSVITTRISPKRNPKICRGGWR
jgi:hypothetical protein